MFARSVTLFEIFGFKIAVNISWTFIAVLLAWSLAQGYFPAVYKGLPVLTYWWMGLAGVMGLFASIILHELSHSLVGRMYGVKIKGITLWLLGGAAELEDEPPSARAEFYMAIAGPAMSVALAVFFWLLHGLAQVAGGGTALTGILIYLAMLNLILAIFNLVPAFPLDGGRVLRAVLWAWTGDARGATRTAARIGSWFGILLMIVGIFSVLRGGGFSGLWWFIIGMFVRMAADSSYQQFEVKRVLQGEKIRHLMTAEPIVVSPDITVGELISNWIYRYHHEYYPVVEGAILLGFVSMREIRAVPEEKRESTSVRQIMRKPDSENSVNIDQDPVDALKLMQTTGNSRLLVLDSGKLAGIVTLKDLIKLISIKVDLQG